MNIKQLSALAVASLTLAACQSNVFHIQGSAENMADGDTLFLTSDMIDGVPTDTLIVKNGKFQYSGPADSTHLCMVYSAKAHQINAPFFVEPGTVTIRLSATPGGSRVGGTAVNMEWQRLNDSVMTVGKEIHRIAERIYGHPSTPEEQQRGMNAIEQLDKRFSNIVIAAAERNINNEFGYFVLTYYPEDVIPSGAALRLIRQMPPEFRQRAAIKQLEQQAMKQASTAVGAIMPDFTMPSIGGTPTSALSEVKKNRITIIDFWASWCGPCRAEMPSMVNLYQQYKGRGLGILGISLDNKHEAWQDATRQLCITWPQMSDLKGWDSEAAALFNVQSIPFTIVVDQQGKILARELRGNQLSDFIANHLK